MSRFIILILLSLGLTGQAQQMLPGQKGIELKYGVFPKSSDTYSYFISAGLISYRKNGNYIFALAQYDRKYYQYKTIQIPIESFLINAGYSFYFFGNRNRNMNINLGIGGAGGYEQVNQNVEVLDDGSLINKTENIVYGMSAALSLESYLTSELVFLVEGKLRYLENSQLNPLQSMIGFGFRYNF